MQHPSSACGTFSPQRGEKAKDRTRSLRMRGALPLATLFVLLTFPLFADLTQSALTGEVKIGNAPAAGVTITATSRATQTSRTATTNARGRYWIGALTPGAYDITFSRAGLTSLTRPVIIQLGRIARADARLEISADEESVQSTATTVSVAESTVISTHWSADELERTPLRRDVITAIVLSPVFPRADTILNDATVFAPSLLGEEALDEVTVVRGAQPIELDSVGSSVILARTRSGSHEFTALLRGTYSTRDDGGYVLESASGGRIVPQRLWFFASGWAGDPADLGLQKLRGLTVKADAQAGAAHHLTASHFDADAKTSLFQFGTTTSSLRYTGVLQERLVAEAIVSRARVGSGDFRQSGDEAAAKVSYRVGDHVVSAGGSRSDHIENNLEAFFVSDRWSAGPWTVDAGVRRDEQRTTSRVAAAFDLQSERGSHAIVASWGEYLETPFVLGPGLPPRSPVLRLDTLCSSSSLESTGAARVDVLHYDGALELDQVQLDARYRMFDRLEAGGSYVYTRGDRLFFPEHLATARVGVQVPLAGHEFAATILERYDSDTWRTDVGVRYEIPYRRVALTVAADAHDVLEASEYRLWARIRR